MYLCYTWMFLPNILVMIDIDVIKGDITLHESLSYFILGVAPPSIFAIQTGTTLYEMTESSGSFSWFKVLILAGLAFLSILPVLFKTQLRRRLE